MFKIWIHTAVKNILIPVFSRVTFMSVLFISLLMIYFSSFKITDVYWIQQTRIRPSLSK